MADPEDTTRFLKRLGAAGERPRRRSAWNCFAAPPSEEDFLASDLFRRVIVPRVPRLRCVAWGAGRGDEPLHVPLFPRMRAS